MHMTNGFYKQSQSNYIHTDEDCEIHLHGEKCGYSKCRDIQGQTGTDMDIQGHTGTDRERQG